MKCQQFMRKALSPFPQQHLPWRKKKQVKIKVENFILLAILTWNTGCMTIHNHCGKVREWNCSCAPLFEHCMLLMTTAICKHQICFWFFFRKYLLTGLILWLDYKTGKREKDTVIEVKKKVFLWRNYLSYEIWNMKRKKFSISIRFAQLF